ncbi:hypothetical protein [Novosphingobium sp. LASN5T]|uniref:hypothetical protein n=1 Tax=Novosphingobium sp. LASN5T TaxID=2491021 RepID=UPI000F6015C6|nr:hypothetical protein [Novosphingobium sp. LASN5T]RQW45307.1 hypothetical protein EH199_05305 [Novosphingobium sp. LASN5T]
MTTMVTSIRLQVEGGPGFVGQMKDMRAGVTGVAEAEKAAAAVAGQLASATNAVAQTAQGAAAGLARVISAANENTAAFGRAAAAGEQYASMAAQLRAELDPMFSVQQRFDQELQRAETLFRAGAISSREYAAAQRLANDNLKAGTAAIFQTSAAHDLLNKNLGLARAGWQSVGFQLQDVFASYASGAKLSTIAAQQIGQLSSAISMVAQASEGGSSAMGRFASFMASGWGVAVGVAVSLAAALANAIFTSGKEADTTSVKQRALAEVLNDTKASYEEVTKAIADYVDQSAKANQTTLQTIQLEAQGIKTRLESAIAQRRLTQAMLEAAIAQEKIDSIRSQGPGQRGELGTLALDVSSNRVAGLEQLLAGNNASIAKEMEAARAVTIKAAGAIASINADPTARIRAGFDELRRTARDTIPDIDKLTARLTQLNKAEAAQLEAERKTGRKRTDRSALAAARLAQRQAEFGEDTDKALSALRDQFTDTPAQVRKVNAALLQLRDIKSDIDRRPLLPGSEKLNSDIEQLGDVIRDSLNKPFEDYLQKARESAQIDELLAAGKDDQAKALQAILGIQREQDPLNRAQLQVVLETVEAERRRSLVLRDQRALIQANVTAVQDMRGALNQTVADALRGRFSVNNILSSFANSYVNLTSQRIVERMFGDTLRALEDQASGQSKVDTAGTEMAAAMGKGTAAVIDFAEVLNEVGRKMARGSAVGTFQDALGDTIGGAGNAVSSTLQGFFSGLGDKLREQIANDNPIADAPITVVGKRTAKLAGETPGNILVDMASSFLGKLGLDIPAKLSDSLKSTFNKLETALPNALAGAFTGASASRIILGDRGTGGSIGSAIGGALGGKLGEKVLAGGLTSIAKGLGSFAGPLGSILGGVVGGLLGGAFKSTTKGYAVVTNSGVSSGGNNNELVQQAATSGSGLQSTINQIAQQLGASVGNYSVSIGKRSSGWISVSASGSSQVADKSWKQANVGGDLIYDGKDEAAAIAVAISNAIADGAISGISQKVQAALLSTKDIDGALREAVKVQDLELALGGVQAALEKEFRTFEQTAKDRLSLAQKYGFDIVEVEKLNAKERLGLSEKLLKEQVGSLQDLITEMTSGSLYEGSAVDQRKALLAQIETAKADVAAGVEGSADRLTSLYQQLNSVSKDVFGSTGGFAADRAAILDGAQQAVNLAKSQIADAQKATDPALKETNTQLDEVNGQLAKLVAGQNAALAFLNKVAANSNKPDMEWVKQLAYTI